MEEEEEEEERKRMKRVGDGEEKRRGESTRRRVRLEEISCRCFHSLSPFLSTSSSFMYAKYERLQVSHVV